MEWRDGRLVIAGTDPTDPTHDLLPTDDPLVFTMVGGRPGGEALVLRARPGRHASTAATRLATRLVRVGLLRGPARTEPGVAAGRSGPSPARPLTHRSQPDMLQASPPAAREGNQIPREQRPVARLIVLPAGISRRRTPPLEVLPNPMPNGPDQRPSRNRRPRRRSQTTNRLPVTEQDEVAELEAARERNDLDIRDLREMSVKELREVASAWTSRMPRPRGATTSSTRSSRPRPSAPASTTRSASSTSSTTATASCAATASCRARTTSTSARARSAASGCGSATGSSAPCAPRTRARSTGA